MYAAVLFAKRAWRGMLLLLLFMKMPVKLVTSRAGMSRRNQRASMK